MQDRPTAVELLEAVREFLEIDVLPELSGRRQFHTRVAINVLGILAREWEHEEDAVRAEWERLVQLLGKDGVSPANLGDARDKVRELNQELSARIRDGSLDNRWQEVIEAVRATVLDKLAIANPTYVDESVRSDEAPTT